jgi:hypothetical protein
MRWSRNVLLLVLAVVVVGTLLARFCRSDERQAIRVDETRVVVTNLTKTPWSDVTIWLNDYYRAQAPALAPDQRLEVPLRVFAAARGQRFEPHRAAPAGIEVTARAADGSPVTLTWGSGRRR